MTLPPVVRPVDVVGSPHSIDSISSVVGHTNSGKDSCQPIRFVKDSGDKSPATSDSCAVPTAH